MIACAGLYHDDQGRHTIISNDGGHTYRVHDREAGLNVAGATRSYTQALGWLVEEIDERRVA